MDLHIYPLWSYIEGFFAGILLYYITKFVNKEIDMLGKESRKESSHVTTLRERDIY